jgi:hypothetical protein
MTATLQEQIRARRAAMEQAAQQEEARREQERQIEQQRKLIDFQARIDTLIPARYRTLFGPIVARVEHHYIHAAFTYEGVEYHLQPYGTAGIELYSVLFGGSNLRLTPTDDAATLLLDYLATVHLDIVQRQQTHAAREAQERAAYETALAEDTRLRGVIDASVAERKALLWQWPAGRELTLYHWRWATAPAMDEDTAEYDEAWATTDRLDRAGWFTTVHGRRFNLGMHRIGAVVEAKTFTSVEQLPRTLRRGVTITLPDIDEEWNAHAEHVLLCARPGAQYLASVGEEPVDTIKALLER